MFLKTIHSSLVISVLTFGLIACEAEQAQHSIGVPDMDHLDDVIELLSQNGQFEQAGALISEANTELKSSRLDVEAALYYAMAEAEDAAERSMRKALQHGFKDPTIRTNPEYEPIRILPFWADLEEEITRVEQDLGNPDSARFVVSDLDLFWQAFEKTNQDSSGAEDIIYRDYILKGSAGLRDYYAIRYFNPRYILNTTRQTAPKYYQYLKGHVNSGKILEWEPQIRRLFRQLKSLYPGAVFPDVYFVVGLLNSAGTVSETGLFIGVDMFGMSDSAPTEELNDWNRAVMRDFEAMPEVTAHELMHFQQNYQDSTYTLLGECIKEGACDFLVDVCLGRELRSDSAYRYFDAHKAAIWRDFLNEKDGIDLSKWLYNGDYIQDRPADLGYVVGYQICKQYYEQAEDKRLAIGQILNINNFNQFFEKSGYEP